MKTKVLVILNRLVIGGQTLDTVPLLYHLKDDFEMEILYGRKEKDEQEAVFLLQKFGHLHLTPMRHFRRSVNLLHDARAFFFIYRTIKKYKPAVVHTHGLKAGIMGRTAAYFNGVKCIIHTFHGHHFHSYFNRFISKSVVLCERALAHITTKIVAISNSQKAEFAEVYKIAPAHKIQVIPLGIDELLFSVGGVQARANFRQKYSLGANMVAIGIIGRIVPVKNYALFVNVVAKIAHLNNAHQVKFFVIGDGNDKKKVEAGLDAKGITWCASNNINTSANVVFTSWIEDVAGAVHGLDVVVLTSHNEGTPLSLIEAQFCGKPVVATNVGGVKDTLVNGQTGFLVPPGNVDEFAEKLLLLVNNAGLRQQLGNNAAVFASQNFSKASEANSFRLLYNSCTQ